LPRGSRSFYFVLFLNIFPFLQHKKKSEFFFGFLCPEKSFKILDKEIPKKKNPDFSYVVKKEKKNPEKSSR